MIRRPPRPTRSDPLFPAPPLFRSRLAGRGWPVGYSPGLQSLWERHGEKWRRGGLLPTCDRVEAGDGAVVMVDRPGKGLPLRNHEGAWNFLATGRHARHLLKGAADRTRDRKSVV